MCCWHLLFTRTSTTAQCFEATQRRTPWLLELELHENFDHLVGGLLVGPRQPLCCVNLVNAHLVQEDLTQHNRPVDLVDASLVEEELLGPRPDYHSIDPTTAELTIRNSRSHASQAPWYWTGVDTRRENVCAPVDAAIVVGDTCPRQGTMFVASLCTSSGCLLASPAMSPQGSGQLSQGCGCCCC